MITMISVNDFQIITTNITTEIPIHFLNICTPISKSDLTPLIVVHLAPVCTSRDVGRNFRWGGGSVIRSVSVNRQNYARHN